MSKTAARFTLADIARAIRAAKEQGAAAVEILKSEAETPKVRDFKL
jgi:hypothetical protein